MQIALGKGEISKLPEGMSKYKIVAIIELFLGLLQLTSALAMLLFVIPKLSSVYSDFNVKASPINSYIALILVLLMGIVNLFFSFKLFANSKKNKEQYFKYGIISAISTFFLMGVFIGIANFSILSPLYNLTSQ